MHRLEFIHRRHARQLESVVLVRFAFDIAPLPGIFIGRTHQRLQTVANSQIVDPAPKGRKPPSRPDRLCFS